LKLCGKKMKEEEENENGKGPKELSEVLAA
jgi:hypothetical protein